MGVPTTTGRATAGDVLGTAAFQEEGPDAPASAATTLALEAGTSLVATLDISDVDWVRLEVTPGATFSIRTADAGGVDDTILFLMTQDGEVIAEDDDGGEGFFSEITYTAQASTYYVAVSTYETHFGFPSGATGTYRLSLEAADAGRPGGKPVGTVDEIADQLATGYWVDTGRGPRAHDIDFALAPDQKGTPRDEAALSVDIRGLSAAGRWFAEEALAAWTATTGITFQQVRSGADIEFFDDESGAFATSWVDRSGRITAAEVNVSEEWIEGDHYRHDTYSLQTFLHEIGHVLGLGHPGDYNYDGTRMITHAEDADFANDTWQMSVMSYFSQTESPSVEASRAYVLTPMLADLAAMEGIYGRSGTLRTGDTTYGDGSTAGDYYDIVGDLYDEAAFTLVDEGGHDRLVFDRTGADQVINLEAGSISSVGGLVGNMAIALGTRLEDVTSGRGDDRITGNGADNRLEGGGGDDRLYGARGADSLFGGAGADTLDGGWARDSLDGGKGSDALFGDDGDDVLAGAGGADTLNGGDQDDSLHGGSENDSLSGGAGSDTLVGGRHDDTLKGGGDDDTLKGGSGADSLLGGNGIDTLEGEAGDDTLAGGDRGDGLHGGSGADHLYGEDGRDTLKGGRGDDTLDGGTGLDRLSGNRGNDQLNGRDADDRLWGHGGQDALSGGAGHDRLYGGTGADMLEGGAGDDTLSGQAGDDQLAGDRGRDVLHGGKGADMLTGGAGADTFRFEPGDGIDTITDFTMGEDRLDLTAWGLADVGAALDLAEQRRADVALVFDGTTQLLLQGLTLADLDVSDILL